VGKTAAKGTKVKGDVVTWERGNEILERMKRETVVKSRLLVQAKWNERFRAKRENAGGRQRW
jgi:hypothetical protein